VAELRRICSSYSDVWMGDSDDYEEDHGWIDEEGETFAEMYWPLGDDVAADHVADLSEGETAITLAVKFLRGRGATLPSSSHWMGRGVWYSTPEFREDDRVREESYHLRNFHPEEERRIFELMGGRPARAESY